MSDWTLGAIKARNMEIVALCEQESCRHLFIFDLDQLIEGVGGDYKLADFPPHGLPGLRRGAPRYSPFVCRHTSG